MKEITVTKSNSNQRLDKFVFKYLPYVPKSLVYKYIRKKYIRVNGKKSDISCLIKEGDIISFYIKDEFFEKRKNLDFLNAKNNLDILYEDKNIIIVNKERGLVVHTDESKTEDTLINRIKLYLYKKKEYNPYDLFCFIPVLCNRLDRNTSGIVICAKNFQALRIINDKIKNKEIIKKYLCLVYGRPNPFKSVLSHYLIRDKKLKKVFLYDTSNKGSKNIITEYEVLDYKKGISLLEVNLITGRTHQIRAHLNYIGHPLIGETKYADNIKYKMKINLKNQALCAYSVVFNFKTDAGMLNYLCGKKIEINNSWVKKFFYKNI